MSKAYVVSQIRRFVRESPTEVLGQLAAAAGGTVELAQLQAWTTEIDLLKSALDGLAGELFLEYTVPRLGTRIDAVVIAGAVVIAIEFKVGAQHYGRADFDQTWDYALDLKNFHAGSHSAPIIPVLVATDAAESDSRLSARAHDGVHKPIKCNAAGLRSIIRTAVDTYPNPALDAGAWAASPYRPTPTIIEAAQALYARHSVDAIARSDAGARNLAVTSQTVETLVERARTNGHRAIAFVTGVPGAGKTLVGLNVAAHKHERSDVGHAVFLSGNDPLVQVLTEALARDEVARQRRQGNREFRKGDAVQGVKAFIHHIRHFRDAGLADPDAPFEHVVIFDEAQRAWDRPRLADFMAKRRRRPGFTQSEPELLLSYMNRHRVWTVVVCLVGGGQEINRGEAGISEWLNAVREHFPDWHVYISPELHDSEYAAGEALHLLGDRVNVTRDTGLHLSVSMRSFRAESLSRFVKAVLDHDVDAARSTLRDVLPRYPVTVTRDLHRAKQWIREHARGSERYGLVASSAADRLKPHAIDVRVKVNPVQWFLSNADDTRSSYYLEDAATEFQVQGLELDWACVTWDADLRQVDGTWSHHEFRGTKWNRMKQPEKKQYLENAYRVLLTRARQGMVVFVPPGDRDDHTRLPKWYDATFDYLAGIGLPVLT